PPPTGGSWSPRRTTPCPSTTPRPPTRSPASTTPSWSATTSSTPRSAGSPRRTCPTGPIPARTSPARSTPGTAAAACTSRTRTATCWRSSPARTAAAADRAGPRPRPAPPARRRSEAQRLWHQDHGHPAGRLAVDDQRLGQQCPRAAEALHAPELPQQAVLAQAAQALGHVADQLLVPDHQDDVARGVGVGPELAAGPGTHDDLAVHRDRVRTAHHVV